MYNYPEAKNWKYRVSHPPEPPSHGTVGWFTPAGPSVALPAGGAESFLTEQGYRVDRQVEPTLEGLIDFCTRTTGHEPGDDPVAAIWLSQTTEDGPLTTDQQAAFGPEQLDALLTRHRPLTRHP